MHVSKFIMGLWVGDVESLLNAPDCCTNMIVLLHDFNVVVIELFFWAGIKYAVDFLKLSYEAPFLFLGSIKFLVNWPRESIFLALLLLGT